MKIAFLTHPEWINSASMRRFADMLAEGMSRRGHEVSRVTAPRLLSRLKTGSSFVQKCLGYGDQFVLFPQQLKSQLQSTADDTLFVVTDQALGMWIPHIRNRPHVVHCHDFLALRSAMGEFVENPTSASGKQYQSLIRKGFSQAKNFVSVSTKTQADLHAVLDKNFHNSKVIYNGLNGLFAPMPRERTEALLRPYLRSSDGNGVLLHVGGNHWYKNRSGVIRLYAKWCQLVGEPIPLWMVGEPPTNELKNLVTKVPQTGSVRFLTDLSNDQVNAAYSLATLFLFPSLEEGFGWPIAEAMACGTPVLTTDQAPMTEVGADAATYLRRLQVGQEDAWASEGAELIQRQLDLPGNARDKVVQRGFAQASKFDADRALSQYEDFYQRILYESNPT